MADSQRGTRREDEDVVSYELFAPATTISVFGLACCNAALTFLEPEQQSQDAAYGTFRWHVHAGNLLWGGCVGSVHAERNEAEYCSARAIFSMPRYVAFLPSNQLHAFSLA